MLSHIRISCPVCRCHLKVWSAEIGLTARCRCCDEDLVVEVPEDPAIVPSPAASASLAPARDADVASFSIAVFTPAGSGTDRSRALAQAVPDPSGIGPGVAVVQCDPGRSLPAVVPVLASELEARREALERVGVERDELRAQVEQLQAELVRLGAERAGAECRHEAVLRRSEELAQTIAELRGERDHHGSAGGQTPSGARVPAVEITTGKARTDEGWADHHPSERFRAAVTSSMPPDGGTPARSEWLPKLRSTASSPFPVLEDETLERAFPREADLALVRAQVEVLNQLLRAGPATGHVLIYQQRLTQFVQKIREASRLASSLASAVEQSRRRDEMQYHMYLVRRAGEIDKEL
jgi:hypothetical protein